MHHIELKILIGMHRTVNEIDRKTSKIVSEYKLSLGQFAVMEALYHKGDMTVGMVQKKILSSSGTIPLIVNNLVKRGCVERKESENDRRQCILHLTEEGKKIIKAVAPQNEKMVKEHLSTLTEEEQDQLIYLIKKISNLENGGKK